MGEGGGYSTTSAGQLSEGSADPPHWSVIAGGRGVAHEDRRASGPGVWLRPWAREGGFSTPSAQGVVVLHATGPAAPQLPWGSGPRLLIDVRWTRVGSVSARHNLG